MIFFWYSVNEGNLIENFSGASSVQVGKVFDENMNEL